LTKKRNRWSLRQVSIEFNLLVAKIGAIFERSEVPKRSTRKQRIKIKREVHTELARIAKEEKQPTNVVADTITLIADKERKKAIRNGDYASAVFAGIVQYYANQASKSPPNQEQRW
jgi:CO dehydrogenase/acetyl-CoA synthase epsilon subunit